MPKLPQVKPKDLKRALKKGGFYIRRQKGSHLVLQHNDGRMTVIPLHNKPLPKGTLLGILKQAKISVDDLIKLIK